MAESTIYARTEAGQAQAREKGQALDIRQRTLLMQIDGRKTVAELRRRVGMLLDVDASLRALLSGGLVRAEGEAEDAGNLAAAAEVPADDWQGRRARLLPVLHEILGPDGDNIGMRLENTKNAADYQSELERAIRFVEMAAGASAAARVRDIA